MPGPASASTYAVRVADLSVRNRQPEADAVRLVGGRPHGCDGVCHDPAAFAAVGGLEVIARGTTGPDHDRVSLRVDAVVGRP